MIDFFYDKKTIRKRMWNLFKALMGQWLVLGIIALIFLLYITPAAIFSQDSDAIVNAIALLGFLLVLLFLSLKIIYPFYEEITSTFKKYAKDGMLHYFLFVRDSRYVLKCMESKNEFEFSKDEIKDIQRKNGLIVIRLNPNRILDFPDREDIYCLFENQSL